MGKSTIPMDMFNRFLNVYQMVNENTPKGIFKFWNPNYWDRPILCGEGRNICSTPRDFARVLDIAEDAFKTQPPGIEFPGNHLHFETVNEEVTATWKTAIFHYATVILRGESQMPVWEISSAEDLNVKVWSECFFKPNRGSEMSDLNNINRWGFGMVYE